MQKTLAIILLLFTCFCINGQTNLDSLYSIWQDESQTDSSRVMAYRDYIYEGFIYSDPDTAFILCDEMAAFGNERNYPIGQAQALLLKGIVSYAKNDDSTALNYYTQSLKIYKQAGDQEGIANSLNKIGKLYIKQSNYPKALDYFNQSLAIGKQLDDQKGIAYCLNNIGNIYDYKGDNLKALDYHNQSLAIRKQIGDQKGIATSLNNIGIIYKQQGNYPKALDYYTQSLKIQKQIGDQDGIARSLSNIGNIYRNQGDYLQALDYYTQSLAIQKQRGDHRGMGISLNNIGIIYRNQGDYHKALDYHKQSLEIRKQRGDQKGIATVLNNIGNVYYAQGDYSKALDYYTQTLAIKKQIDDQGGITYSLGNIGVTHKILEDYPKAVKYCQRSYELAVSISALEYQKIACGCLYDSYKAMGNGIKALEYHELLNAVEDSLNAEETAKQLQQMEFTKVILADSLAHAERERIVEEAHQEEVRKKNKTRNMLAGGGLILLILAGAIYSRLRYTRKAKAIIEKEKDRSENLLLNILPEEIAQELKEKGKADARDFDLVSILFTDFKGFTAASAKLSAQDLVSEINTCFKAFDGIISKYKIEKIKTIGDAYMAAGGLPVPTDDSIKNTVLVALEMQSFISKRKEEMDSKDLPAFEMRVGIHTGPVVAGIVGVKKFQYDIWGDTVNTASRMESSGEVGKVNISKATYKLLKDDAQFVFESRGKIEAKGKGEIEMFFVSLKTD